MDLISFIFVVVGVHDHSHAGESGVAIKSTIVREVKDKAKVNPYQSAYSIAESCVSATPRVPNQHAVANLGRIGNRHRQHCRPRHPADLMFDLDLDHIPQEFDVGEISVNSKRHVLLLTDRQLDLLARARCWFVDGKFIVVKAPFIQLWSIHAFVRVDDAIKQMPLAFVLMSSRRSKDYRAVLKVVVNKITRSGRSVNVECIVSDFESAVWKASREVLLNAEVRGCVFHWRQAVWRHLQQLGLQTAYNTDTVFTCTAVNCWHYLVCHGS